MNKSIALGIVFAVSGFATASAQVVVVPPPPPHPVIKTVPAPRAPAVVTVPAPGQPVVVKKTVVRHPKRKHHKHRVVKVVTTR